MRIVFPEGIVLDDASLARCRELGAKIYPNQAVSRDELAARLADAEIAVLRFALIDEAILAAAPHLRAIIVAGSGLDSIDRAAAQTHHVLVMNCPTHNTNAVAEQALALMLMVKRRLVEAVQGLRAGRWEQMTLAGSELRGSCLGVIGNGYVGGRVAAAAEALGMDVRAVDSDVTSAGVDELLRRADVVCLCLPLTAETYHFIDARRLALLKPTAALVNVGRGATVDQTALLAALKQKCFAGAGLDVFEDEFDLAAIQELANLPNVVATPHIGFNTAETEARRGPELLQQLECCITRLKLNPS